MSTSVYEKHDNIYVNLDMFQNLVTPKEANLKISSRTPFIEDTSKWAVAIEKASLPLDELSFLDLTGSNFYVTVKYGAISVMKNVKTYFKSGNTDPKDYNVYEIIRVVDAVNKAINECYREINTDFVQYAPILRFNSGSELFSLLVPTSHNLNYPFGDEDTGISVFFNHPLYLLFKGLPFYRAVERNQLSGFAVWKMQPFMYNLISYPTILTGPLNNVMCHEVMATHSSLGEWSDIDTIIFTTSLPIRNEYVAGSFTDQNQTTDSMQIMTTLSLNPQNILSSRSDILYSPNNRRYINLLPTSNGISSIGLQLWTRSKKGVLKKLEIGHQAHLSVTLVFSKISD